MKSDKSRGRFRQAFTKEKVIRFIDKQGFYIVLFVCIAIIGVTAFLTSGKNPKPPIQELADNEDVIKLPEPTKVDRLDTAGILEDKISIKIKDSSPPPEVDKSEEGTLEGESKETLAPKGDKKEDETKNKDGVKDNDEAKGKGETKNEGVKKEEAPKEKKETPKKSTQKAQMIYPVQGNVSKGHIMDELVFSNTLKEWTTHSGMDIESFVGSEVKAAMGGTVEEITEDRLMGICITLDHGNGLKTYYANLSTGNMVSVGQKVDKGQIISGVGRTASCEILDDPHLHFEVMLDGKSLDPLAYLQ
ncbi:MAG TPA: M23 family metallopeptidase [Clostridia bacterium]|nr:M23 family metallopeptidase [Clostridia bacterium]